MLLSCGDALIDFLPATSADDRDAFVPAVGGSCLNVAVGMARLGAPSGFMGGLSTDMFGEMIAAHALASGVELRYATRSERPSTLAFVRTISGEPHYAFRDEESAARHWVYRRGSLPFAEIDAVHVGSTTLVNDNGAAETLALVEDAPRSTTISFDPNCRPNLVRDRARYVGHMEQFVARADIVRMSDFDFQFLYGSDSFGEKAKSLLDAGKSLVIVTRGTKGALAWHRGAGLVEVASPTVDIVDTIGAGDSFQAGLLFGLRTIGRIERGALACMSTDELHRALTFAATCAAITVSRAGADLPRICELEPVGIDGLTAAKR
jgi:fructokinase